MGGGRLEKELGKDVGRLVWSASVGWAKAWGVCLEMKKETQACRGKATLPRPRGWGMAGLRGSTP